ncbi:hypothetical protein GX51_06693 [Blastomyces parvus]|uniref:Uncharacterized protein n=1 Tax=Blastomyces parvus TaxID=2060905 RepID=A0A2B7WQ19_9EURO|nr:hypothetical protein GX51_06693 [Blastomyces parvus]
MNQQKPGSSGGLETNYAEVMPGGNAEFVPYSPRGPQSGHLHGVHTKPRSPFRSRRLRILLIAAIALVCIGIGIGIGVAIARATQTGDSESDAPSPANTSPTNASPTNTSPGNRSPAKTSSTTSPTATTAPNRLNVLAAVYGNGIVTADAKQLVDADGNMAFDSNPFPFQDTLYANAKCFSLLHQLGSNGGEDMRIFLGCENTGFYKLEAGPIAKSKNTQLVPKHDDLEQDGFRIISVIWGATELRERNVHEKVFKAALNRESVTFTNEYFGMTTSPGPHNGFPVGVVFYRPALDRPIRILYSLVNGTRSFDFS